MDAVKKSDSYSRVTNSSSESSDEGIKTLKKQLLEAILKNCEMLNKSTYSADSWNTLMDVYGKAKSLAISESPSLKGLNKAINELSLSLGKLEAADKKKEDEGRRDELPVIIELSDNTASREKVMELVSSHSAPSVAVASVSAESVSIDISI